MVVNGICPIFTGMSAGASGKVVFNPPAEQTLMQIFIHLEEEIVFTTVESNPQIAVIDFVYLIDNSV